MKHNHKHIHKSKTVIENLETPPPFVNDWVALVGLTLTGILVFWGVISIPVYLVNKVLGG